MHMLLALGVPAALGITFTQSNTPFAASSLFAV
jgi:hypothetical protein